jgi:hypothetical protein
MNSSDVLLDAFGRVQEAVRRVVTDLSQDQLAYRVDDRANSIGWLVWHLTRVQDDHVADVAGREQVWREDGWVERFGLPFEPLATGYAHGPDEVRAVRVDGDLLLGYHDAVFERTVAFVGELRDEDLTRVVDESWHPPVTLGVRLVSIIGDDLQHVGQAAFVRGLLVGGTG